MTKQEIQQLKMYDLIKWNNREYCVAKPLLVDPYPDYLCVEYVDQSPTIGWEDNDGSNSHYKPGYIKKFSGRYSHIDESQYNNIELKVESSPINKETYLFPNISEI